MSVSLSAISYSLWPHGLQPLSMEFSPVVNYNLNSIIKNYYGNYDFVKLKFLFVIFLTCFETISLVSYNCIFLVSNLSVSIWWSFSSFVIFLRVALVAQTVKRLPAMWETQVQSLAWEDPLEKEMATHSSNLAWKIPWTEEPDRLQSMESQRVGHDWAIFFFLLLIKLR